MKRAYADIPEGQIHYRTAGSGESLLLLHGTPSTSEEYEGMIPILAKSYRVIAMDTLGFGMSDDPARYYAIEDYARSIISFLDALGISKTSFITHHTGSTIAVDVAITYPERVDKLVLAGVATMDPGEEWKAYMRRTFGPESAGGPTMTDDGAFLANRWWGMERFYPHFTPEAKLKHLLRTMSAHPGPHKAHRAVEEYDIKRRLPLIKQPVLLVMGSDDVIAFTFETTKQLVPRNKAIVIDGGGNALAAEKPEEYAQAALAFLQDPGI